MPELDWITIRAIGAAALLATLWVLEGAWPEFAGRTHRNSHYATNVALGLINAGIVALLFSGALLLSAEFARERGFGLLHWIGAPAAATWVLAILFFDAWQYAWHVMNHKIPLLWRFHAVHHSDAEMDASTAVRFHTGEIALSSIARMAVLPLLGMTIVQLAVYEAILLPVILFHHSNFRVPAKYDRLLRLVIVTPWIHWVHHSEYQPETDSNYSSVFSWWDRLFRTYRIRQDPRTIQLGLRDFRKEEWRPLSAILAIPFKHDFRRKRSDSVD